MYMYLHAREGLSIDCANCIHHHTFLYIYIYIISTYLHVHMYILNRSPLSRLSLVVLAISPGNLPLYPSSRRANLPSQLPRRRKSPAQVTTMPLKTKFPPRWPLAPISVLSPSKMIQGPGTRRAKIVRLDNNSNNQKKSVEQKKKKSSPPPQKKLVFFCFFNCVH